MAVKSSTEPRRRNPRGSGGQLRTEIVDAARELLIETGSDSAVTLRAIARRVGIAAPSIYAHFDDAEQVIQAVVGEVFTELVEHLERARTAVDGPRERLVACCRAYVAFGAERPTLYALLFSRPRPAPAVEPNGPPKSADDVAAVIGNGRPGDLIGGRAFGLLLQDVADAIADGASAAEDPLAAATGLWVSMHGLVLLRATAPQFPWPESEAFETGLIARIARLS